MTPPIATHRLIAEAIEAQAWFAFSLSGGKDSTASAWAAMRHLDAARHPRSKRIAIHADLGRAEWETTPATVEAVAARLGVPLIVVRRRAGDMVQRWEQRFANGKARYESLSTYGLIGPWSNATSRFCTSELKAQVIGPALARRYRGETIVSVIGIRREESARRRKSVVATIDERFARSGNARGTTMLSWHPLADWTAGHVFAAHAAAGLPLHEAYRVYGSSRLSCRFCVLAAGCDLAASAAAPANAEHYRHLVTMEAESTFSFQPGRWLADIAPHLLSDGLARDIGRAKQDAVQRRTIEAGMPAGLRYIKGWPPRMPAAEEAHRIALARAPILARHRLDNRYPDGRAVMRRFAELMDVKAACTEKRGRGAATEEVAHAHHP